MNERDDWHLTDDIEHERGSGDPFAAAVRATRMPMVITDPNQPDNPIIFCNEAFQKLSGYDREEIIGTNCRFLQGPDTDPDDVRRIHDAVANGEDINVELLNYRKDGTTFWNALYLSPVRGKAGDIQFFFASQLDVTDRVEAQRTLTQQKEIVEHEVEARTADLRAALDAKTLLLHEVDHRVKNNLNMIGSLLRLQGRTIGDPEIAAKLNAMLQRVDALSTVHRRLYQADDITRFDIGAFVDNLVSDVVGASGCEEIVTEVATEPLPIESTHATALGLIVNEVLTNAIKHAYADCRHGTLTVRAHREGNSGVILLRDDGPGIAGGGEPGGGLGSVLIRRLAQQVGATVTWSDAGPGVQVVVRFPVSDA